MPDTTNMATSKTQHEEVSGVQYVQVEALSLPGNITECLFQSYGIDGKWMENATQMEETYERTKAEEKVAPKGVEKSLKEERDTEGWQNSQLRREENHPEALLPGLVTPKINWMLRFPKPRPRKEWSQASPSTT
ncbi:hypothetical protein NDU88_009348 [Pleurodeles waltl]|uniref:Uncharacterized protein n=1 Tax=Pleurodeles waltl TaxID=8319 RepID=A0AAV7RXB6_PLEWA|nr:hypothetical protein NDU88_009348 [Pleurodeles waltl]